MSGGRVTARDAIERFLHGLADLDDPAVFTSVASEDRLQSLARVIDNRPPATTPLRGRVFAVKDNIDVVGLATTAACRSFGYEPAASASVVQQLVRAGAVPVGKTNMDQFATGLVGTRSPYGTPVNPLDPSRIPGGSSSGSAVAVASGLVDFALGTDTAGSGRVPAAMCGIVGLKPTLGRLSSRGVIPAVRSLDTVSIFARELWLAEEVMAHCSAFDPADVFARRPPERRPVAPSVPRVGVVAAPVLEELGCSPSVVDAHLETVAALAAMGARIQPVDPGPFLALGEMLYGGPWLAERTAAVGDFIESGVDDLDPTVAAIIAGGREFDAIQTHRAAYARLELLRDIENQFVTMDVLMLPTVPMAPTPAEVDAAPIDVNAALGRFTTFANLADLCAVTIPVPAEGPTPAGGSVSLLAPAWHESVAVAVAEIVLGEARPVRDADDGLVPLVVAGAHLRGEALEDQLLDLGAVWQETTTTAPTYRLWAMHDTEPPKPALVFDPAGVAIEVDVWRVTPAALGEFVTMVPAPLALGKVDLVDGRVATGFVCEPRAIDGATEISHLGSWRAYEARTPSPAR